MSVHPPNPLIYHALPRAPHFVGREAEMEILRARWTGSNPGVIALVGLGGSGKTAMAARFLDALEKGQFAPSAQGLFVWSFYQEPDAGRFLDEAYRYFCMAAPRVPAKGTALMHLLAEALSQGGPHLLVLDGLEKVQHQDVTATSGHGRIEDPLLRSFVTRIAKRLGQTVALVTSRFPLSDLDVLPQSHHSTVTVSGLDQAAACELLRARGVRGDDQQIGRLIAAYGAHALTLDHLGGLIGQFLEGDPGRAPEAPELSDTTTDRQALRLARLLASYEEHLTPADVTLLSRLSVLRRNLSGSQIVELLQCSPPVSVRIARESADWVSRLPTFSASSEDQAAHMRDAISGTIEALLCEAPIAGPPEHFFQEVANRAAEVVEQSRNLDGDAILEVVRRYQGQFLDEQSDQRPLPPDEGEILVGTYSDYLRLRGHHLLPFSEPGASPGVEIPGLKRSRGEADLTSADILESFRRARRRLHFLVAKHLVLCQVRAVCRQLQQKWSLAGPLAPLDSKGLRDVLGRLVGLHLIVPEGNDTFSVHPALRDHFSALADKDHGAWHGVLREQLLSLARRPGRGLPEDAASLDFIEEAIHHALATGDAEQAWQLYNNALGGVRHLAWKLGEVSRGLRILRSFEPCPDRWAAGWYLRALGDFEEAFLQNDLAYFRADIRLLQGRLPEVALQGDPVRSATARFLMGETTQLPDATIGCAVPRAQLLLYLGNVARAVHSRAALDLYQEMGWNGDGVRCRLLLAEAARRQADMASAERNVTEASKWIFHAGSVEHLCLLHLVRARIRRDYGQVAEALKDVDEGLHLSGQCSLGLYHVELLCEQGSCQTAEQNFVAAEHCLRDAFERACQPAVRFLWGAAMAGSLLAMVLVSRERKREARAILNETLAIQKKIGDPGREKALQWLGRLEK